MNNKLILNILIFLCQMGFAQNDSILMQRLSKPIITCEVIATNAQAILPAYALEQSDSIAPMLAIWKKVCGNVEPIQRIQILLDIHTNRFVDSNYKEYISFFIYDYKHRLDLSKLENHNQIFEYDKLHFNYVPLGGAFDAWTKTLAQQLLPKQLKGSTQYLFCLLFSNQFERYEQEIQQKSYMNSIMPLKTENTYPLNPGFTMTLTGGVWIPTGALKQHFEISPQMSFQVGIPLSQTLKLGVIASICKLYKPKPLEINVENSITKANPISNVGFGGWLAKEWRWQNHSFIDAICGLALNRMDTDVKKINPNNQNDTNYGVATADFWLGLQIRQNILKHRGIGFQFSYHFAPYNWDNLLKTPLGNQFLAIHFMYRMQS